MPLVTQDSRGISILTNHQPGQLYAFRTAAHITVLRTLNSTSIKIGIEAVPERAYTCVAINGLETKSMEIKIRPTGEYYGDHVLYVQLMLSQILSGWTPFTSYLRFSNSVNEMPGFISTKVN